MLSLIGVDHSVQHDGRTPYEGEEFQGIRGAFRDFLARHLRETGATIVAEELNEDALKKFGATKSVAQLVASELNLKHIFCEPSNAEREQMGVSRTG